MGYVGCGMHIQKSESESIIDAKDPQDLQTAPSFVRKISLSIYTKREKLSQKQTKTKNDTPLTQNLAELCLPVHMILVNADDTSTHNNNFGLLILWLC